MLFACSNLKPFAETERDVFIASLDRDFDSSGRLLVEDTIKLIHFSKNFWNYFIRTHPISSAAIFISPQYDSNNNYLSLGGTSFTFYNITHMDCYHFTKLLADSVNSKEKEGGFGTAFFVIPNDTSGTAEKEKAIGQRLKEYTITPTVRKEFDQLKNILTFKDTSYRYIIVFKKNFADRIFKLYEWYCRQHRFSAIWTFEKVFNLLSLIINGT